MYTASDLRKGLKIQLDDQPWIITDFEFSKPGKGQAIYNCKMRNMLSGTTQSRSYRSGDTFEKPELTTRTLHFSYVDGDNYVFSDDEDFSEVVIPADVLGQNRFFLTDNMLCEALFFRSQPIEVTLPNFIERTVVKCEPGVKGNTASGKVMKPATLEGGYELPVPLFVNEGDVVRVDTRSGEYLDRVRS
ncbi:MAG: elongation factor P [Kiritimatiellia bacterium]|jgi:elongation factor P